VLAEIPYNPLISAAHRAIAQHRPLVLSPDIIWLTIAQGLAIHINVHAEQFRDQSVDYKGRKEIHVDVDSPVLPPNIGWGIVRGSDRRSH
jgi:hypothetical protein